LACRTLPPIDQIVFQQFCALLKSAGKSSIARFRQEEGKLYISGASWTPRLRDTIDSFLTNAENVSAHAQQAHAERARLERHKKDRAIDAAARGLGVPIK
jgi:hypothetical protein